MVSLCSQMLTAHERQSALGAELMYEYARPEDDLAHEAFLYEVQDRFVSGQHASYVHAILRSLLDELGSQQRVADALGLKDRTSISKMLRSETMEGKRLTAALDQFRDIIKLPSRSLSALFGFARAAAYIKSLALKDASIERTMTPQAFSLTVGMLASRDWDAAVRDPDPERARRVAERIISERAVQVPWPEPKPKRKHPALSPEQYVRTLLGLRDEWGTFAVVALTAIPERIPVEEDGGTTL